MKFTLTIELPVNPSNDEKEFLHLLKEDIRDIQTSALKNLPNIKITTSIKPQ